jgi:site-specific recombinase XerD
VDYYEFLGGQNSDETVRAYKTDLEQYKNMTGGEMTRNAVIYFRDTLLAQGLSASSVARKMSTVRSYCDYLRGQGLLNIDPFAGVKSPKVSVSSPTEAFTDEEVRRIFTVAENNPLPKQRERDLIVLGLLFYAGLRRNEVVSLLINDVMIDADQLILRVRGKGGKFRQIPAHPRLQQFFVPFLANPVWRGNSATPLLDVSGNTIYTLVKKYAKRAGIKRKVSPHSCRATAISQLLENGESPRNVADFAGHASVNTTIGSYDKKRDGIKNSSAFKLNF